MQIKNTYSLSTKLKLAYWLVKTKLICKNARLIRFPFDIRGQKFINLGHQLTTGVNCRLEAFSNDNLPTMLLGTGIQINDYVHICAMENVTIGNNVLIASHVYISDNSHGSYKGNLNDSHPDIAPKDREYITSPVKIGDNVWIGEHVVILPGVTIGKGSVIGANSIVTKNVPEYTIAAGLPAKPIKEFNLTKQIWEKI